MANPWWDVIGKGADVLSVFTFFAAGAAWWQVLKITSRYQALVRLPEHMRELEAAATEIVTAAPSAASDPDAVLAAFSKAEGKLTSMQDRIGGWRLPWSRRRGLVLEIIEVRDALKSSQAKGATVDRATAMDMYRRVTKVAQRIADHVADQRLER